VLEICLIREGEFACETSKREILFETKGIASGLTTMTLLWLTADDARHQRQETPRVCEMPSRYWFFCCALQVIGHASTPPLE
jgi:hypothetical protein